MDMKIFQIEANDIVPCKGRILISSPFLMDYNFSRSVILLVQHSDDGSMGIVINKGLIYNITLNDIFPDIKSKVKIPLFKGGPLARNSLFYIHKLDFIHNAIPLGDGVFINGDFNDIMNYIDRDDYNPNNIKFFCGYASWQIGQLQREINENSWIVSSSNRELIFDDKPNDIWGISLDSLGGKYSIWAKYPKYPILN